MRHTSTYLAWRNFVLVFASFLCAQIIGNVAQVQSAIISYLDFNEIVQSKFERHYGSMILAIVIVIYYLKSVHGVLVLIYQDALIAHIGWKIRRAIVTCGLLTLVILSLSFIQLWAIILPKISDLFYASEGLVLMIATPFIVFTLFDICYDTLRAGLSTSNAAVTGGRIKDFWRRFNDPTERKEMRMVVTIWRLEDFLSGAALIVWFGILFVYTNADKNEDQWIMYATLGFVFLVAFIHSVLDYYLNRHFFFNFAEEGRQKNEPALSDG